MRKIALLRVEEVDCYEYSRKIADAISEWREVTDEIYNLLSTYSRRHKGEIVLVEDMSSQIPLRIEEYVKVAEREEKDKKERAKKAEQKKKDREKIQEKKKRELYEQLKKELE